MDFYVFGPCQHFGMLGGEMCGTGRITHGNWGAVLPPQPGAPASLRTPTHNPPLSSAFREA